MRLIVQEAVMAIRRNAKARRKRKKASITTTAGTTGKTVNKASPRPVSTKKAKPPAKTWANRRQSVNERPKRIGRDRATLQSSASVS
jgi:hypothetical protein